MRELTYDGKTYRGETETEAWLAATQDIKVWKGRYVPWLKLCVVPYDVDLRGARWGGGAGVVFLTHNVEGCLLTPRGRLTIIFNMCAFPVYAPVFQLPVLQNYAAFAYTVRGETYIRVGCRDFTLPQARKHWRGKRDRAEMRAAVEFVDVVSKARGWPRGGKKRAKR